jgi:IS5 family transposase
MPNSSGGISGSCVSCAVGWGGSSRRKIEVQPALEEAFALPLGRATQIRSQQPRQRGWKLYSFHAPEVECIGKGKAGAPYEFGVKASIVTNNRRAPGGLFVLHARAMPDNPYDGHTLRDVIDRTETLTGCPIERAYVDKGYRGHDAQNPHRVFISGQKRGVFGVIKRELRRRSAIEPIIAHLKAEGHLGRCYLKGRAGDAANVVLSAVGHNFRRIRPISSLISDASQGFCHNLMPAYRCGMTLGSYPVQKTKGIRRRMSSSAKT